MSNLKFECRKRMQLMEHCSNGCHYPKLHHHPDPNPNPKWNQFKSPKIISPTVKSPKTKMFEIWPKCLKSREKTVFYQIKTLFDQIERIMSKIWPDISTKDRRHYQRPTLGLEYPTNQRPVSRVPSWTNQITQKQADAIQRHH